MILTARDTRCLRLDRRTIGSVFNAGATSLACDLIVDYVDRVLDTLKGHR